MMGWMVQKVEKKHAPLISEATLESPHKMSALFAMIQILKVVERFQELFAQTKYKEVAELVAESPQEFSALRH
ncbi:Clathrin heavy chain 2 [Camellia lanceoleosa]|nr:Clathrin heavy chain 2 [Camellia lanceoleosa]